jgi:uncharacterized protein YjiS (DUF1127 family)
MFAKIRKFLEQRITYKNTLKELARLSDKELADIGINRHMIHDIARENANEIAT